MSSPLRPDRIGVGTKPTNAFFPIAEQIINITPDVARLVTNIGDATKYTNSIYKTAFGRVNATKLQMALTPTTVVTESLDETRALFALNDGEIAFTEAYLGSGSKGGRGLAPGRRRADRLNQGMLGQVCLPVMTTLASESSDAGKGVDDATLRNTLQRLDVESRIRVTCIVKPSDSSADMSGNTEGYIAGPHSFPNFGTRTLHQGQLICGRVAPEEELRNSMAGPSVRDLSRPILLPHPVDWVDHDLSYMPRLRLAIHNIEDLMTKVPDRLDPPDQYESRVRSVLQSPYDKAVYDLFLALATTFAFVTLDAANRNANIPEDTILANKNGAWKKFREMIRLYNIWLPHNEKPVAGERDGTQNAKTELWYQQNLSFLIGAIRATQVQHDQLIFARAEETIEPGQVGRIHPLSY